MPEKLPFEVRIARQNVARVVTERNAVVNAGVRDGVVDHRLLDELDQRIGELLDETIQFVDPCDASEVDPLLLLPVRLETRFDESGSKTTLRVRIYPDEIHVDDLVRGVTDDETRAAMTYWTSAWTEPVPESAWPDFVAAVGSDRAEWVAHVHTPTNLAERGATSTPQIPKLDAPGVRNVIARALPDRFVVVAVSGSTVSQATGTPIPRDLALSPIPLTGDQPTRVADALTIPPGSEWLIDFEQAVAVGMAVTIELDSGTAPLDRVVAIGTKASLGAAASADEFEDLLAGHRYRAGLAWLPQGTPTNNADGARSPYQPRRSPEPPMLTPSTPPPGSDTSIAADVLGVDRAVLARLVGDGISEQQIARDTNTALWAPGWGEYLSRLDVQGVPGVVDAERESARELFSSQVRGRGPAPTLQVGAQPYGILPVSDLRTWEPRTGETTAGIVQVVRVLFDRWLIAAALNVPRLRSGARDLDKTLLDVMGSSPVMQGLRVRPVLSDDVSKAVLAAVGHNARGYDAERLLSTAVASSLLGKSASKASIGSLHRDDRPLPLPLVSRRDGEFIDALLESPSRRLPVDSVLQALLVLAWESSDISAAKAAPSTVLPTLIEFAELTPELKTAAASMVARADDATPTEIHELVGRIEQSGAVVGGASMLFKYQPIEQLQTSLAEVALSAPDTHESRLVGTASLAGWLLQMGYKNEVRLAMKSLAATGLEARRLAVAEALDCSSHRLDAWVSAVVADRRATQSARKGRGLTIGAYGVVENLAPQAGPTTDGWIHAPSTRHAIAAGMLRSSHLSHLPMSGPASAGGPFAIDMSSGRIRAAAHVIEGVRQGQPLGALVGYEIERALASARLARLQLSLRTIAPLAARRLHDTDDADTTAAKESTAANNVVDGVLLLAKHEPGDVTLRNALDVVPQNVYLDPGDWTALTDAEWNTITRIMTAAADTIDAVADVMLSEAVLQYAGGNAQRAAAAMDAMSTGTSPADTLDILETQDSAERLTHRVLTVVSDAGGGVTGWNAGRPRAQVEPRLEAWAQAHLGDAANIVLTTVGASRITMADSGFAALDVVFATDLVALERALRAALTDLDGHDLAVARDPAWPKAARSIGQVMGLAFTLRSIIAGSTPLLPGDLTRPGVLVERDDAALLAELVARTTDLAASLTAAVTSASAVVSTIPDDGIVTTEVEAEQIAHAIEVLEPFGVAFDVIRNRPLDVSWARNAWLAAEARALTATAAAAALAALPAGTVPSVAVDSAQEAVGVVFGDGFRIVPLLSPAVGVDPFIEAAASPAFPQPTASAVRRFVRDLGTVRSQMTRLSEVLLLEAALGHARGLEVVQLSEVSSSGPAPGTTHWLAGPLPATGPWPRSPVAHIVLDHIGKLNASSPIGGLVIDAWVEDVPGQVGTNADPNDPRPGRARTGLAVRCDSASARPPQSILVAVSPNGKRWTTDALRGVVEHTMDLARIRMVTLERLAGEGLLLPALYTRSSSLQGESHLQFVELAKLATSYLSMPFVKETMS